MELEGRSGPLKNFHPFTKVCTIGMYYGAWKILIADVKCTMKTSFLPRFMSLGDQGDPADPSKPPCITIVIADVKYTI